MIKYVEADQSDGWCNWFAWYPIYVNLDGGRGVWVFWEKVQRKVTLTYGGTLILIRKRDGTDL